MVPEVQVWGLVWSVAQSVAQSPGLVDHTLDTVPQLWCIRYQPSSASYCEQLPYIPNASKLNLIVHLQNLSSSRAHARCRLHRRFRPQPQPHHFRFAPLPTTTSYVMATLSPLRLTERIDRPRTAPPRTGSGGILRTSSLQDFPGDSLSVSPRSVPLNISFAPLPEIGPRKRRSNRPLGVAARSSILHRQRANLVKHSDPTTEAEYQHQQQPPPFDISGDAPQLWSDMDDPQHALQMAMAAGGPEPSNIECPTIVYVENGEPQQPEPLQVVISVSTPKRNRSRKTPSSKAANKPKNPSEWGAEEGTLHELRKIGAKDKDGTEGGGLKFWRRLAKRNSTPILPVVRTPNDQIPGLPITATIPTMDNSLFDHRGGNQSGYTNPLVFEGVPSEVMADVVSPSIVISPVEALEPSFSQSASSTAASSSPPTPEMQIQSVSPIIASNSYDSVPTPPTLAANGVEDDGKRDTPLPIVELLETKRHSVEPYSQYERVPFTSAASL